MFPPVQRNKTNKEEWLIEIAGVVNRILDGKINSTGQVTLTANATSTTVVDFRIGNDTGVHLSPTTANAATAIGTTYHSATSVGGSFTLTHANSAQTDRTFNYVLIG